MNFLTIRPSAPIKGYLKTMKRELNLEKPSSPAHKNLNFVFFQPWTF